MIATTDRGTTVRPATIDEMSALPAVPADADESLRQTTEINDYHMVAVETPGRPLSIHVLGWRWGEAYITSPVVAMSLPEAQTVRGKIHMLRDPAVQGGLHLALQLMVRRAMREWGYGRVL